MSKEEDYGFTPIFDELIKDYGLIGASVFGLVWRYCHRAHGFSHPSQKTMSKKLGISTKSVQRSLMKLCEDGMIVKVRESSSAETAGYLYEYEPAITGVWTESPHPIDLESTRV